MINLNRKAQYSFEDLVELVNFLRAPGGCPWDGAQTHLSIRQNFIEEAYEACEGFDLDDPDIMCEELGDVLLQVLFHTDIEREAGRFSLSDVCTRICEKLIRRHPQLFSGGEPQDWDALKREEKGQTTAAESMNAVARSLPALMRAQKIGERLNDSVPIDTPRSGDLISGDAEAFGDALFYVVRSADARGIDAEAVLHQACERIIRRTYHSNIPQDTTG